MFENRSVIVKDDKNEIFEILKELQDWTITAAMGLTEEYKIYHDKFDPVPAGKESPRISLKELKNKLL